MQRDYILRLIEQMGQVLIVLRRRILARALTAAEVEDELLRTGERAGLDLEMLRGLAPDTLVMLVAPTGEVEPGRCWMMAELLYLDGLQAGIEEQPHRAADSLRKAVLLYRMIEPGGGMLLGFPEAAERIAEIEALRKEKSAD